jgi:eukaryotic-like serine/threonine-protein kinase
VTRSRAPGTLIARYRIVSLLGAGGMGEVYRAHDQRLGRDVAIKVLPESFSADPDRLRRFEHEARAAAALNHPHIVVVYDVGTSDGAPYIVSELLEGATLRERLASGPLRNAVDVGRAIARGLAAAHAKGIVHRDLKPENVFLTADGGVKILDFGLAKLIGDGPDAGEAATKLAETQPGVALGTLGYMAPEQLRGQVVDHRVDVFALGALVYEMVSGRRAFPGGTTADRVAAILGGEPPSLTATNRAISPALARIVSRCLEKDPASRFQSASDLAFALEGLSSPDAPSDAAARIERRARRNWLPWAIAGLATAAAVVMSIASVWRTPAETRLLKTTVLPPPETAITDRGRAQGGVPARRLSLSPDGQWLAFTAAGHDGVVWLWVRRLDSLAAARLEGTQGAVYPFWSPDSKYLGFFSEDGKRRSKLMTINMSGGTPTTVCDLPTTNSTGGTWSQTGVILFGVFEAVERTSGEIRRVSASGGTPQPATTIDSRTGERRHYSPYFLPDGRHFLYLAVGRTAGNPYEPNGLFVASLDSSERTLVMPGGATAKFANGHVLFARESMLFAQPFDVTKLKLSGEEVLVADQLFVAGPTGAAGGFSVSNNGYLAYQGGTFPLSQLTWFNRKGESLGTVGERGFALDVKLSPDDSRAVVTSPATPFAKFDLWIHDLVKNVSSPLTFDAADELAPVWSPDGGRVAFTSNRTQDFAVYAKWATGAGTDELWLTGGKDTAPVSWSPDGQFLLYVSTAPQTQQDLRVLSVPDRKHRAFADTPFAELQGEFSPDGKWVAYVSNEPGRREVYAAPFPGPGDKIRISFAGGQFPRWRGNGPNQEIFYRRGRTLIAVAVSLERDRLRVTGETQLPINAQTRIGFGFGAPYDVSRDGQRFLLNQLVETGEQPVTLVTNWMAGLRK